MTELGLTPFLVLAAFLFACVVNGWDVDSYLDPEHPLQRVMRDTIEEFTGESIAHTGVDGCGTPVFAVTLRGLARAVGRVGRGVDSDAARLSEAIRRNGWALDNATVRTVIEETGLVAKSGAEGVFVASDEDGTALAIRVLDGSQRALAPVALSLLEQHGSLDPRTAERVRVAVTERVLGAGVPVGELRSVV